MLRFLRVQPGEGRAVLACAGLMALLQAGVAMGMATGDALFLARVGVEALPLVYIATPAAMLLLVVVVAGLLGHVEASRVLEGTLVVLVLGGITFALLLRAPDPPPAVLWAVKLYAVLLGIGLYSLFWNVVDRHFDIQDGKRLFALFSAGGAAGAVVGSLLVVWLTADGGLHRPYLAWAALAAMTLPLVRAIRRHIPTVLELGGSAASGPPDGRWATLEDMSRIPFVRRLIVFLVVGLMAGTVLEFQVLRVLSDATDDAEELARLLGGLFALVSLFNLLMNTFAFNRLVARFGVGNLTFWLPGMYLGVFAALLFLGGVPAAVVGFFAFHGFQSSIEYNNQNFLFAAIPSGRRQQIRTVLEGMAEPLATATGGLFLLLVADRVTPLRLSAFGAVAAGVYLSAALAVRSRYGAALAQALRRGWLDLSRSAAEASADLDAADLDVLERAGRLDPDPKVARSALRVLSIRDPERAAAAAQAHRAAPLQEADFEAVVDLVDGSDAGRLQALGRGDERSDFLTLSRMTRLGNPTLVTPMLSRAGQTTPPVQRAVCRVIEELGLRGIPPTVAYLMDRRAPYSGRRIAARALGRAAPEHLDRLAPEVVSGELGRAHRVRRFRSAIAAEKSAPPGLMVLSRFMEDTESAVVDFTLEILSIVGRLPDHELLVHSLRRYGTRERANALETLEQGVPRDSYGRLRPLLDPVSPGAGATLRDIAETSLHSFVPIESAAAFVILQSLDATAALVAVEKRLASGAEVSPELAGEMRRMLLGVAPSGGGLIEKLEVLVQAPSFRGVRIWDLEEAATESTLTHVPRGAPTPVAHAWLVAEGSVVATNGQSLGPGTMGSGALSRTVGGGARGGAEGARILVLPADAVRRIALRSPRAALNLLDQARATHASA